MAAVRAAPENDLPRLIYADWLDDTGADPDRAAFIRLQCLARSDTPDHERARPVHSAEREHLRLHGRRWVAEDLSDTRVGVAQTTFSRGFVAGLRTTQSDLMVNAHVWLTGVPLIQLHLTGWFGVDAFASICGLAALRELSVMDPDLGDYGMAAMSRWLAGSRVECLTMARCGLSADGVDALVAAYSYGWRPERLDLSWNPLGPGATLAALASPDGRLQSLNLTGCGLGDPGAVALVSLVHRSGLRGLSVGHNQITDDGLSALADAAAGQSRLCYLDVTGNRPTGPGLERLNTLASSAGVLVVGVGCGARSPLVNGPASRPVQRGQAPEGDHRGR